MPNRLTGARSAYLVSAAHQPVDWYPWSDAAFDRARAEDKPILLDIGAVWCHWCHVIDRESYDDPETAAVINANFVAVKVDRDERPDVDVRYQNAVSAITGQGGWPLTAFLTPDGHVFFGGTYFPPDGAHGRPGFKQVLRSVAEFYRTRRDQAHGYAGELHQALHRLGDVRDTGEVLTPALVAAAVADITRQFDAVHGGFGGAPKFPHSSAIELLLRRHDRTGDPELLSVAARTLEKMARGGVYDQLGGGFHRYSVDAAWIVPHFEKMLYDNAGLLANYAGAFRATGRPVFRDAAAGIIAYVRGTLMDRPEGGFYTSQDADISLDDDGDYYTWTREEAAAALNPDELAAAALRYHLDGPGEMPHDPRRHVLYLDKDPDAVAALLNRPPDDVQVLLARAQERLLAARAGRTAPFVDRTIYAGWNGMMISAFFAAARVPGLAGAADDALRALERVLRDAAGHTAGGRGFRHVVGAPESIGGLLDDQVQLAGALLDAFEHTGEPRFLRLAAETAEYVLEEFRAPSGAFYDVAATGRESRPGGLGLPYVPVQDAPTPSGNGVAVLVLERLAALTGDERYRAEAERALRACAPGRVEQGLFTATLGLALETHLAPPLHVVIVGPRAHPNTLALRAAALGTYRHGLVVQTYDPEAAGGEAGRLPAVVTAGAAAGVDFMVAGRGSAGTREGPRAYACTATECAAPAVSAQALTETIRTFGRAAP
ncbi:MAG TPA: thioredoxin domain-containing protein [bacterium]|nr:thioredoxin domain-containing protein [bacterium]